MTADYLQALNALGPVGVAMGDISAVTPCALGYCARVGIYMATGPTPAEAVRGLLRGMADACRLYCGTPVLHEDWRERHHRLIDVLAVAFEAVGGRWWEV